MLTGGNTTSMDIPDLVRQALGDEEIQAGVSLGDEDAVCLTPTRTLVYNGEGLLSDEQVEEFPHDAERIAVSEGRRKTKFLLEYIEGTRSFTVPSNRDEKVLELLLEGVLRVAEVIDQRESLVGVYRFSELTLIVSEGRLIKLIGEQVWNDDYEVYPYDEVTRLDFERASVATSIVVSVGGRPQRIKVPNDNAPIVRQTIEKALFNYYDVASLEELNDIVDDAEGGSDGVPDADGADSDIDFGSDIDPLVTDEEPLDEHTEDALEDISTGSEESNATADTYAAAAEDEEASPESGAGPDSQASPDDQTGTAGVNADSGADIPSATGGGSGAAAGSGSTADTQTATRESERSGSGADTAREAGAAEDTEQADARESPTASAAGTSGSADASTASAGEETDHGTRAAESTASTESAGPGSRNSAQQESHGGESTDERAAADARDAEEVAAAAAEAAKATATAADETTDAAATVAAMDAEPASREDVEAVAERIEELTDAVDRQNELLKRQHSAIKQLVDELRSE
jgi:hypothetical protein